MASTELRRTISSAGSTTKWGGSVWVKLSDCMAGVSQSMYCSSTSGDAENLRGLFIRDDGKLQVGLYDGSYDFQIETNRLLRDPNAFYHICVAFDTTEETAADRVKIWINGVLETSFATASYPAQDSTHNLFGTDIIQLVGSLRAGSDIHHSCIMSHLYITDGYVYPASTYGSTDATTGEWKINTSPTIANYGTNGFLILKDGNTITDQSGGSNDFTLASGTLTNTEDCPSDVFATFNPLDNYYPAGTFSNGNNTVTQVASKTSPNLGTIGVNKGKFYWEIKPTARSGAAQWIIGVASTQYTGNNQELGDKANDWGYDASSGSYRNNDANTSYGNSYDTNDIIGVALDLTNSKLYFSKNSVWQDSGDPTSGATGTGAISITAPASTPLGFYFPAVCYDAGSASTFSANFGNGYFGTTAISSEGTNASNIGKFEYDVPTGFTALSTKGFNE